MFDSIYKNRLISSLLLLCMGYVLTGPFKLLALATLFYVRTCLFNDYIFAYLSRTDFFRSFRRNTQISEHKKHTLTASSTVLFLEVATSIPSIVFGIFLLNEKPLQ